jgi:HEAT repeat protein
MNRISLLITLAFLATRVLALDSAELDAVAQKFAGATPDDQYLARVELNRVLDTATAPGKGDPAAVTQLVVAALEKDATPVEAKKYLLRALARIATGDAAACAIRLFNGPDAMLKEEARQVLESIPGPQSAPALEQALRGATTKRDKLGLINSLALAKASSAVPSLASLMSDADPELARTAVTALAKIGDSQALDALQKALAAPHATANLKSEVQRALLLTRASDSSLMNQIYGSAASAEVKLSAFLALTNGPANSTSATLIEAALKEADPALRQAALRRGLEQKLPKLLQDLAGSYAQFSKAERLTVLANIQQVQPAATAEAVALSSAKAAEEDERAAGLTALGHLGTAAAFDALLEAVGAREPAANRAAGYALAEMNYPEADARLLALLKEGTAAKKLLAIKATAYRLVPGTRAVLLGLLLGSDREAAQEAAKTLYLTANLDDIQALCAASKTISEPAVAANLTGLAKRIADRLESAEARKMVEGGK